MDKTTKIILAFIAVGLWANALSPLVPAAVASQADIERAMRSIKSNIGRIQSDFHSIHNGSCSNSKIC